MNVSGNGKIIAIQAKFASIPSAHSFVNVGKDIGRDLIKEAAKVFHFINDPKFINFLN